MRRGTDTGAQREPITYLRSGAWQICSSTSAGICIGPLGIGSHPAGGRAGCHRRGLAPLLSPGRARWAAMQRRETNGDAPSRSASPVKRRRFVPGDLRLRPRQYLQAVLTTIALLFGLQLALIGPANFTRDEHFIRMMGFVGLFLVIRGSDDRRSGQLHGWLHGC
jgi:hypothetical protein